MCPLSVMLHSKNNKVIIKVLDCKLDAKGAYVSVGITMFLNYYLSYWVV